MRFRRALDGYNVYGEGGAYLGHVAKREKRYHLRRTYVLRGWTAKAPGGIRVKASRSSETGWFSSRGDAAEALRRFVMSDAKEER